MKNTLGSISPFIIALSACTVEPGEFSHPTEASVTSHTSSIVSLPLHPEAQKVAKTRCQVGDEVWATLAERFSCKELQPKLLHDFATKRSFEFIEKITQLLATAQVMQHPAPVSSSNFLSMVFIIGEANGKHDSLEVYYNNYEAKAYLYLDAHPVEYGGTVGKEYYSFALSVSEQAPVQPEVFQSSIDAITSSFVALMHQHGVNVPTEFEK